MKYENVICKVGSDGKPSPLKNMIFVKHIKPKIRKSKGIILSANASTKLPIGEIVKSSTDQYNSGQYIVMTSGADRVIVDGVDFRIYKDHMVVGLIEFDSNEQINYK
jgi:co-chaperonin GroES (HSP10)